MAIVKPSALVGGISGNVGGGCFVNTRGSMVLRKTKTRTPPTTKAQMEKHTQFQNAIIRWRALTAEKKLQWNTAALTTPFTNRLGVKSLLSGYQYFLKINIIAQKDDPPQPSTNYTGLKITFTASVSTGMIAENTGISSTPVYDGYIYAMPLHRDNPPAFVNFYRSLGFIEIITLPRVDFTANYNSVFSPLVLNQWVALRWISFVDGALTSQIFSEVIQTTA